MRPPDWQQRLADVVATHRAGTFEWGHRDCAALLRDTARALGAPDPFDGLIWDSELSAAVLMLRLDARSVREYLRRRLQPVAPAQALRGDVGYPADVPHALMCPAVIVGAEAVSRAPDRWAVLPRSSLVETFRLD
jgi:hypothetical protein